MRLVLVVMLGMMGCAADVESPVPADDMEMLRGMGFHDIDCWFVPATNETCCIDRDDPNGTESCYQHRITDSIQ